MIYLLWAIIGVAIAGFILVFQYLSVNIISSQKPSMSKGLILGGAVIRWVLIATILYFALSTSLGALLICFASLMLSQMLFLIIYNHYLSGITIKNQLLNKDI